MEKQFVIEQINKYIDGPLVEGAKLLQDGTLHFFSNEKGIGLEQINPKDSDIIKLVIFQTRVAPLLQMGLMPIAMMMQTVKDDIMFSCYIKIEKGEAVSVDHVGDETPKEKSLEDLNSDLNNAVAAEDWPLCIQLRDLIKSKS